jgi:3'(2'), 5'-bisphosphate nucleotidase
VPALTADDESAASRERLVDTLTTIVSAAAAAILRARTRTLQARDKADQSPVTSADHAAEDVILEGLARALPGVTVVSEEAVAREPPSDLSAEFVLVDPLDGTRELIAGRDEFTVNLALVANGRPRLGIIAAPAQALLWRGIVDHGAERLELPPGAAASKARKHAIRARPRPASGMIAAVSRSHLDPQTETFLAGLAIGERLCCGSAIKFCQVAEGRADVYPRLSTTCEWDVAAGHAILVAAGGTVATPEGLPLQYGRRSANFRVPAFVAWGADDRGQRTADRG